MKRNTVEEFGGRFVNMARSTESNGDGVLDAEDMRRHHRDGDDRDSN